MAIGKGVLMVLGGCVVILKVVAPLTKNKADDKALGLVSKLQALLKKVVS